MKIGTLVEIKKSTNDPSITKDRIGVVISCEPVSGARGGDVANICRVHFRNGHILKFHENFLKIVSKC